MIIYWYHTVHFYHKYNTTLEHIITKLGNLRSQTVLIQQYNTWNCISDYNKFTEYTSSAAPEHHTHHSLQRSPSVLPWHGKSLPAVDAVCLVLYHVPQHSLMPQSSAVLYDVLSALSDPGYDCKTSLDQIVPKLGHNPDVLNWYHLQSDCHSH